MWSYYYLFIDKRIDLQRQSVVPNVPQLVSGGVGGMNPSLTSKSIIFPLTLFFIKKCPGGHRYRNREGTLRALLVHLHLCMDFIQVP